MKASAWLWMAFLALGALTGCDQADEGSADEYGAALPEPGMLTLSFDDTEALTGALGADGSPEGEGADLLPGGYREAAQAVMDRLNQLIEDTHGALSKLTAAATPVEVTKGATSCKTWEADGEAAHWSLVTCLKDKGAKKFGFVLKGRPLGSTADADYLVVLAGEGKAMPAWNGKKRGMGRVGYNLDNLSALTGEAVGGRIGITYRSVGAVRALNIGLDEVVGADGAAARSGVYRFHLVVGKGGRFAWVDTGDYLARENGQLVAGQDGEVEWVRAAVAWRNDGFARTVRAACEGTVGQGQCVRVAQCWSAGEELSWSMLLDEAQEITWSSTACKDVPLAIDAEPGTDDQKPPKDKDGECGAPVMPEPDLLPDENP